MRINSSDDKDAGKNMTNFAFPTLLIMAKKKAAKSLRAKIESLKRQLPVI